MADGTSFTIDIETRAPGVAPTAVQLAALADRVTKAGEAVDVANAAVKTQESVFRQAEGAYDRASKAIEKISVAMGEASGAKLERLNQRQAEAIAKAEAARLAMNAEASSLDRLKAAASGAESAEEKLSKAQDAAKKAAKAAADAEPTGQVNEIAEGLGKLGGPLGQVGQKIFGVAGGFKKLGSSLGSAGVYAGIAVALVAVAVGVAAVAAATALGIGKVLLWGVMNTDADRVNSTMDRLKANIKKTFTFDTKSIDKLIKGLDSLVDLFDANSISGKAMQVVFRDIFGGILDAATGFIPKIRTAFIQFEILVLKALIAIKPFGSTIVKVAEVIGGLALVVLGALVLAVGILIVDLTLAALTFAAFLTAVFAVIAGVLYFGTVLTSSILGAFNQVRDYLTNTSWTQIGIDLIMGLVRGLTGASPEVIKAVTGAVSGAITSAKQLLGIASPSKVFAEIGMNTGAGMAQGVDASADTVQGSLESIVSPPAAVGSPAGPAPSSSAASTGSKGGSDFAGATFNFYGVEGAADAESRFREMLTNALEGDRAQLAGAVAA